MRLSDLTYFSSEELKALGMNGVYTGADLISIASNFKSLETISGRTNIDRQKLLTSAHTADLEQIEGVGLLMAILLANCPMSRTVGMLSEADPEKLYVALEYVNSKKHLVKKLPSIEKLKDWKKRAQRIRPIIPLYEKQEAIEKEWRSLDRRYDLGKILAHSASPSISIVISICIILIFTIGSLYLLFTNNPTSYGLPGELEGMVIKLVRTMSLGLFKCGLIIGVLYSTGAMFSFFIGVLLSRVFERRITRLFMKSAQEKRFYLEALGSIRIGKFKIYLDPWTEPLANSIFLTIISPIIALLIIVIVIFGLIKGSSELIAFLDTYTKWFMVIGVTILSTLYLLPRGIFFLLKHKSFHEWSVIFERKWLSLSVILSSAQVLTFIMGYIILTTFILGGIYLGLQEWEQSWVGGFNEFEKNINTWTKDNGLNAEQWILEEGHTALVTFLGNFHVDLQEKREIFALIINKIIKNALIPAVIVDLFFELIYRVFISILQRKGKLLLFIIIQAGGSFIISKLSTGIAIRLGIGELGWIATIYGLITLVIVILAPEFLYGFLTERNIPCPFCGKDVEASMKYCNSCGYRLSS